MQNGRLADPHFRSFHRLFYRCQKEDIEGQRLLGPRIKSFDVSVNWSKYGTPWDVIFGFPNLGIAQILVRQIRVDLPTDRSTRQREPIKPHEYNAVHMPEHDNYAHSEIAVFKDGQRVTRTRDVGERAKKEFRQLISDKSFIVLQPKG